MTREEFNSKLDEYCNKNSLFLPRHQSISDPDIRDFLWGLAEEHGNTCDLPDDHWMVDTADEGAVDEL